MMQYANNDADIHTSLSRKPGSDGARYADGLYDRAIIITIMV